MLDEAHAVLTHDDEFHVEFAGAGNNRVAGFAGFRRTNDVFHLRSLRIIRVQQLGELLACGVSGQ